MPFNFPSLFYLVLTVLTARRKGSARDGEIEEGGEPSDVPSTSGIST
jgi:hypothetical protein